MSDEKLEQLRSEQILCAEQIIKALAILCDATNGVNEHRNRLFQELVKGLPSP